MLWKLWRACILFLTLALGSGDDDIFVFSGLYFLLLLEVVKKKKRSYRIYMIVLERKLEII